MEELKPICAQIEALALEPGFLYTLGFILARDLFFNPEEAANYNWHDHLSIQEITFLAGLMTKNQLDVVIPAEDESAERMERAYKLFQELHQRHNGVLSKKIVENVVHRDPTEKVEDNYRRLFGAGSAMTEPIFYDGSGAYDFQYLEFACPKYRADRSWIAANIGVDIETMAEIARALKKLNETKFMSRGAIKKGNFADHARWFLSVFCFERSDLQRFDPTLLDAFLKAFTITPGEANAHLYLPGQYNELLARPIIKLADGRLFLPISFNLAQSIYESPFYWMNADPAYAPVAAKHRGEFAEQITAELLRRTFGTAGVFTGVAVEKGPRTLTDIDVLAVAGNKSVVAQVKSKRLTELAKSGDDKKLAQDFHEAIQSAYNQGVVSRTAIVQRDSTLRIGGQELRVNEKIDDAYILCVTVDSYPAVTHQVDVYLEKAPTDPLPVAISIFDLDIVTFYITDPFELLYYFRQRTVLGEYFKADSEMALLGFHIKRKLFKEAEADRQVLDNSFAQLIDANFPVLRGSTPRTAAADVLYPQWRNAKFTQLLEAIKAIGEPGFTDALFLLYDLAGDSADDLIARIKRAKQQTGSDHQNHNFSISFSDFSCGLTFVSAVDPQGLKRTLMALARLRKYKMKADTWLALGSVAGSTNIVDAVGFNKHAWREDPVLEEMANRALVRTGRVEGARGEKIGRNDPCPCGSGKKFKRCHGA